MIILKTKDQVRALEEDNATVLLLDGDRLEIAQNEIHKISCAEVSLARDIFVAVIGVKRLSAVEVIKELNVTVDHLRSWIPDIDNRDGALASYRVCLVQVELMQGTYKAICGPNISQRLDVAYAFLNGD